MSLRQIKLPDLPFEVDLRGRRATVRWMGAESRRWKFRLFEVHDLTTRTVKSEILPISDPDPLPLMVHFVHASPEARTLLRTKQISFIGDEGECFLFDPPLLVDRRWTPSALREEGWESEIARTSAVRNPFARTASRVLRLLLLYPEEEFTISELARKARISDALASRVIQSLHEQSWIDLNRDAGDNRARRVRLRRPREALSAWRSTWERRRIQVERWDIRTDSAALILKRLRSTGKRHPDLRWALGGVAGASLLHRAVEPANVLVWTTKSQIQTWEKTLLPRRAGRAAASLSLAIAPDDFIFDLAETRAGVPVADPVQLWLDCSREGERALEAADAIAESMGW